MGRWDITANKASIKKAGATARSTKWYIVNDQMVNELIFDIFGHLPDCIAIIPPNVGGRCFAHFCKADA